MKELTRNIVTPHSLPSEESAPPETPEDQLLVQGLGKWNCPEILSFSPIPVTSLFTLPRG